MKERVDVETEKKKMKVKWVVMAALHEEELGGRWPGILGKTERERIYVCIMFNAPLRAI